MLKTKENIEQDTLYLGSINEPLMIFGGVYSNLQAAEALRDIAEKNNIPPPNNVFAPVT
jgi:TPP-dependent trihydroxycyclohexane-1,2-dione (THcHDO) dehydratase